MRQALPYAVWRLGRTRWGGTAENTYCNKTLLNSQSAITHARTMLLDATIEGVISAKIGGLLSLEIGNMQDWVKQKLSIAVAFKNRTAE